MLVEVTIKATVDTTQFGCSTVQELEDILLDADEVRLTADSMIDGDIDGQIDIAGVKED